MANNDSPQDQYGQGYKAAKAKDDPYAGHGQQQQQQQEYQAPDSYQQAGAGQQQQQQQQQQFASYQAPLSALEGENAYDSTSMGLSGRTEALLSYLFGWISGIVFFVIERRNRFVRFAAAQSILFFGSATIVWFLLRFIGGILGGVWVIGPLFGLIFGLIVTIFGIAVGLVWLYLMFQSYRGKTVRLPFFSSYAQALVDRTTRHRSI